VQHRIDECQWKYYSQLKWRTKMKNSLRRTVMILLLACVSTAILFGQAVQAQQDRPQNRTQAPSTAPDTPREEWSVTEHTIQIGGKTIPYKASAGTTLLKNDAGEPTGLLYSVAYTRSDVKDPGTRPVAFLYNGGPGSASLWLHMGAFGPRRAWTVNGEFTPPAPYKLVDNGESLLDKTDLVFIDAMGTGYSQAAGKGTEREFYGVDEDAAAFGRFIATYISRNDRWNSPKFLIGESYGTFRSAVLGNLLQSRYNMYLNGIVLVSSVLDLSTITFAAGDDRPYIFYLPSYAAVAWYHKALKNHPANLEGFIEEARKYAQTEYADALYKGSSLPAAQRAAVAKRLAYFTGLSEDYLLKANLRPRLSQFNVELLRSRGLTSGRIDARFTGYTANLLAENSQGDPQDPAVGGAYTALLNIYNHDELKFGRDKTYNNRANGANGQWNWARSLFNRGGGGGGFPSAPNSQNDLVQAMIANPKLLVQVENGYYDMATPFFATEFTMTHLGLPAELQKNIKLNYYPSGHMMYLRDEDRVALHNNIADFIDRATTSASKP
jgi:carboxypeptidase C (cathepsin A)